MLQMSPKFIAQNRFEMMASLEKKQIIFRANNRHKNWFYCYANENVCVEGNAANGGENKSIPSRAAKSSVTLNHFAGMLDAFQKNFLDFSNRFCKHYD